MDDFKPKPGSFSTYLEYIQHAKSAPPAPPPGAPSVPGTTVSPLTLLEILARQAQNTLSLPDLQTLSGMEPTRYHEALKSLRDSGCITVEGGSLDEVVKLTDKGAEIARLSHPA